MSSAKSVLPVKLNRTPHRGARGYPGQWQVLEACLTTRVVTAIMGRSWGKTPCALFLVLAEAPTVQGDYHAAYCSPTLKLARTMFRAWRRVFRDIEGGDTSVQDLTLHIQFPGQDAIYVYFWGLEEYDNLRGPRLHRLIIDECKDVAEGALAALRPMLLGRNGKSLFLGTPQQIGPGAKWFKREFRKGQDPDTDSHASFTAPSHGNPYLTDEELEQMIAELDDEKTVREEIYAELIEDDNAVFSNLKAVFSVPVDATFRLELGPPVDDKPGVLVLPVASHERPNLWVGAPPDQGDEYRHPKRYIGGLDFGETNDRTVFRVFDPETREEVAVLRLVRMDYDDQIPLLDWLWTTYNVIGVYDGSPHGKEAQRWLARKYEDRAIERKWSGDTKREDIARGKRFCTTAGKAPEYGTRWHMLNVPWILNEWESFEVRYEKKDGTRLKTPDYGAPSGMFDDSVAAGLLASFLLQHPYIPRLKETPEPQPNTGRWLIDQGQRRKRLSPYAAMMQD